MRIVIAEDAAILRDGLAQLLGAYGHEVVASVGDGDALRAAVDAHRPDVAVADIRMPPTFTDEGLRAAVGLRWEFPELGVLVFSQYVETRYASQLLAGGAGGVGYLLKDRVADVSEFIDALTRVASGATVLDPDVVTQLLAAGRPETGPLDDLTEREGHVLRLMAEGRSNSAIAQALFLGESSIEKHISSIFTKLDLPPSSDDHRRVLAVLRYLGI
jgi:DNA-binding NarL/FixJ family response regulator